MCDLQNHPCPSCGEVYPCYQRNEECPDYNAMGQPCEKCEYWLAEVEREEERRQERIRQFVDQFDF